TVGTPFQPGIEHHLRYVGGNGADAGQQQRRGDGEEAAIHSLAPCASVVMRSCTSSAMLGRKASRPNSLRRMTAVALKPIVGTLRLGCSPTLLRVASSTTGRVTPCRVSSPLIFS